MHTCVRIHFSYRPTVLFFQSLKKCYYYVPPMHTGRDYIVNLQNPSSRTFTITFQPKQLNLTEHVISISDDDIFEDKEHFRLRIQALRFIGGAANRFRVQPGVTSSFAEVAIADDDCECRNSCRLYHFVYHSI